MELSLRNTLSLMSLSNASSDDLIEFSAFNLAVATIAAISEDMFTYLAFSVLEIFVASSRASSELFTMDLCEEMYESIPDSNFEIINLPKIAQNNKKATATQKAGSEAISRNIATLTNNYPIILLAKNTNVKLF